MAAIESCFSLYQLLRNKLVSTARKSIQRNSNLSQLYRNMQEAYNEMQTPLVYQMPPALVDLFAFHFLIDTIIVVIHFFPNFYLNRD